MSAIRQANKAIETAVVKGYKTIEKGVVSGYRKIEDKFVDTFLADEGETAEEAKIRILKQTEERRKENPASNRRDHR